MSGDKWFCDCLLCGATIMKDEAELTGWARLCLDCHETVEAARAAGEEVITVPVSRLAELRERLSDYEWNWEQREADFRKENALLALWQPFMVPLTGAVQ